MRPLFLLLLLVSTFAARTSAQDTILLKTGTSYIAEVTEVGDDYFLYRKASARGADSLVKALKEDVRAIRYKGGYEDVFQPEVKAAAFDFIKFVNATETKGNILEVGEQGISFKPAEHTTDSLLILKLDSIAYIRYSNGYEEKYNEIIVRTISGGTMNASRAATQKADTLHLVSGKQVTGIVSEIGEEAVELVTIQANGTSMQQVLRKDIGRIAYSNGYVEHYNTVLAPRKDDGPATTGAPDEVTATASKRSGKRQKALLPTAPKVLFTDYDAATLDRLPVTKSLQKADNSRVQSLNLAATNLVQLDPGVVKLPNLLSLNLSGNKFREIPESIYTMRRLYRLQMNNGQLKKIDDLPKGLDSNALAILSVANNHISSVDGSLFTLPNLQSVDLSHNEIKGISNVRSSVVLNIDIDQLDLSHNRLREIPAILSRLTGLAELNVSDNQIKSVRFAALRSIKLETLDLSSNPLTAVDNDLYSIKTLRHLNLSGTRVTVITDSISKLSELSALYLPSLLQRFPAGLKHNKNLKELYLAGSATITAFPAVLLDITRLETLYLNGTRIGTVPEEISKLKRLKILSLGNCGLSTVPPSLFDLPRLQRVDLSGNMITSIPGDLGSLSQLEQINFENSPLDEPSLMKLKSSLPYAYIKYLSPELGLNYESKPIPQEFQAQFQQLLRQSNQGDANASYNLGRFFEDRGDYGLAIKLYYRIAERLAPTGSAQHALAYYKIAELYDDESNSRSYNSIYKSRRYNDYSDYIGNKQNNRTLSIYCKLCEEKAADENAYKTMQQACAKAALTYNKLQKNLKELYDFNRSEVTRLVGGAGNMANLSAGGDYLLATSTTEGQAVVGGLLSLVGTIGKSAKETKAERIQQETLKLKDEIERLRKLEEYYLSLKN